MELTWVKGSNEKDPGYRAGFGPVSVTLEMDTWRPATMSMPLVELLGMNRFGLTYDPTGSPSEELLPNLVELNGSNSLVVVEPITKPMNLRKWTAKVNPATGAFSGSFELLDLTQKRKVNFGGVLRQAVDSEGAGPQGRGQYLLPALKTAPSPEQRTGALLLWRLE